MRRADAAVAALAAEGECPVVLAALAELSLTLPLPLLLLLLLLLLAGTCLKECRASASSCRGISAAALAPACRKPCRKLVLTLELSLLLLHLVAVALLLVTLVPRPACVLQRSGSSGILLPLPSLRPLLHAFSLQLLAISGHAPPLGRRVAP
jgi:hypothetical protein